ncbi:DUF3515 domain-containing protein [Streptomyces sp. enrichment culture]|uniref:DUF3515 domain-containing protein n=1 Tax=Streptomyces sp. enrichment culture TaxID=1795815 RepID=UPI003F55BA11
MRSPRHRLRFVIGLPAFALLLASVGCSSGDDSTSTAVPTPDAEVAGLCRNLDEALPAEVGGESRADPEPASALTAGWGDDPAIILRCGVPQPPKMVSPEVAEGRDADAVPGGVEGVDWLMEKRGEGAFRFTTANRQAYVEVTVASGVDSSKVLVDLAPAIRRTVPWNEGYRAP